LALLGHDSLNSLVEQMGDVEARLDAIRRSSLLSQRERYRLSLESEASLEFCDLELKGLQEELANVKTKSGETAFHSSLRSFSENKELDSTSVSTTPSKLDILRAKHELLRKTNMRRLSESRKWEHGDSSSYCGSITSRGSMLSMPEVPEQVLLSPRSSSTPMPVSPFKWKKSEDRLEEKLEMLERELAKSNRRVAVLFTLVLLLLLLLMALLLFPQHFSRPETTLLPSSSLVSPSSKPIPTGHHMTEGEESSLKLVKDGESVNHSCQTKEATVSTAASTNGQEWSVDDNHCPYCKMATSSERKTIITTDGPSLERKPPLVRLWQVAREAFRGKSKREPIFFSTFLDTKHDQMGVWVK